MFKVCAEWDPSCPSTVRCCCPSSSSLNVSVLSGSPSRLCTGFPLGPGAIRTEETLHFGLTGIRGNILWVECNRNKKEPDSFTYLRACVSREYLRLTKFLKKGTRTSYLFTLVLMRKSKCRVETSLSKTKYSSLLEKALWRSLFICWKKQSVQHTFMHKYYMPCCNAKIQILDGYVVTGIALCRTTYNLDWVPYQGCQCVNTVLPANWHQQLWSRR